MTHTLPPPRQHWTLLGTAPASERVWGLRQIEFPCGYHMPPAAFAPIGSPLQRPAPGQEVWLLGGYALQIREGGKMLDEASAARCIAGYRPWVALFHDTLLDELRERNHTIQVWDQGVSIFYSLWNEHCQTLGELIPAESMALLETEAVTLVQGNGSSENGSSFRDYAQGAARIISFMSQFMTLSDGDIYALGPLAASRFPSSTDRFVWQAGAHRFEGTVLL